MPSLPRLRPIIVFTALGCLATVLPAQSTGTDRELFPWQKNYAQILPQGDLAYTPEPFVYEARSPVRYIDFANGNDANTGDSRERPWKHHPWDPKASGVSKSTRGAHTYVFKRGVIYRGELRPNGDGGQPGRPLQLTSDPSWGEGEAMIYGSESVRGWRRQAHPKMPDAARVWSAEVDFLPRTVWAVANEGAAVARLKLARIPNWEEPEPYDVMSEWWTWENPEWWRGNGHSMKVGNRDLHLGISKARLTGTAEDYIGATVWTEWGIVMGSPYPAEVEGFDAETKGVAFRGPWTFDMLEKIITGNRFYLEDKPQWLDQPGEFWVEKKGDSSAVIYLRLPNDVDPNTVTIEAGRRINIIDTDRLDHVEISGLAFRYTNVAWRYNVPSWADPDLKAAVLRLNGSGDGIVVKNNRFEHVHQPIRILAGKAGDRIGKVRINDNLMRHTDHGAILVSGSFARDHDGQGRIEHVELLRNHLHHIGWRIISGEHGHAIDITWPLTSHVAGNFLDKIAGWGISVTGGKPSGHAVHDVPFNRHIVHQNRIEDVLLKSNDWGGIETWQGGPHYVFDNVVINPVGYKNWTLKPGDPKSIGSFGHAYYMDGSFKNYLFNNIAAGRNNELGTKSVNSTALQNIHSFENSYFHNTFYKFAAMTRQQSPSAGRFRYLANLMEDSSSILFRHADPKEGEPDPNASHYTQSGKFAYPTLAYSNNVLHNICGDFGVFEENGATYTSLAAMQSSLERLKPLAASIGLLAGRSSLTDAAGGDFRPANEGVATGKGHRVFVPWSLHGVVGEWHFLRNNADPSEVIDEHWYMTADYRNRESYKSTPRYPLVAAGVSAKNYIAGALEDWAPGALRLDGRAQYLALTMARLGGAAVSSVPGETARSSPASARTVEMNDNDFLIEVVFSTQAATGLIAGKMDAQAGYALDLFEGRPRLRLKTPAGEAVAVAPESIADGASRHLLVEVDRAAATVVFYVDGVRVASEMPAPVPSGSLANSADFLVGGGPGQPFLAADLDFLRVARGTLAAAHTTIEELHAWQFDGPATRDFTGEKRGPGHAAGAIAR